MFHANALIEQCTTPSAEAAATPPETGGESRTQLPSSSEEGWPRPCEAGVVRSEDQVSQTTAFKMLSTSGLILRYSSDASISGVDSNLSSSGKCFARS